MSQKGWRSGTGKGYQIYHCYKKSRPVCPGRFNFFILAPFLPHKITAQPGKWLIYGIFSDKKSPVICFLKMCNSVKRCIKSRLFRFTMSNIVYKCLFICPFFAPFYHQKTRPELTGRVFCLQGSQTPPL